MTQQEIEEAIMGIKIELEQRIEDKTKGRCLSSMFFPRDNHLQIAIAVLKLHLAVMKSGVLQKKEVVDEFVGSFYDPISRFNAGYNQAIDEFTAYLAQKLSGLEKFLYKTIGESDWNNLPEEQVKEIAIAIRKHLEVER